MIKKVIKSFIQPAPDSVSGSDRPAEERSWR